jgi:hypothetical protein
MTTPAPAPRILVDRHFCDLCPKLRPKQPRNCGITFFDTDWACEACIEIFDSYWAYEACIGTYRLKLVDAPEREASAARA